VAPLRPDRTPESRFFYSLNRNKRSVAVDLKTQAGQTASARLIRGANAVVHNARPNAPGTSDSIARASVSSTRAACGSMSPRLRSAGPDAERPAYDLISQALSGLLAARPRVGDDVPRRMGGLAVADFMACRPSAS
jgi:crotonobetainyl-CoA:carnitine CoA-transferase CaiB-like acyl-CoA transferase